MVKSQKRNLLMIIAIFSVLAVVVIILLMLRSPEDTWIKDEKGIWIKHGAPAETPDYVAVQQAALTCAKNLQTVQRLRGIGFNSECLGSCDDYAVDVVHVPRTSEDNLPENQCKAFLNGTLTHFIEIDKDGNIVRVV